MTDKIQDFIYKYGEDLKIVDLYSVIKAFNLHRKEKFIECDDFVEMIKNGVQGMDKIEKDFLFPDKSKSQAPFTKETFIPLEDIEVDFEKVTHNKNKFEWTDELVAQCSRQIWQERNQSKVWTSDFRAEEMAVARFKRGHIVNERLKEIVILDRNGEVTIKSGELNQLLIDVITNTNFD